MLLFLRIKWDQQDVVVRDRHVICDLNLKMYLFICDLNYVHREDDLILILLGLEQKHVQFNNPQLGPANSWLFRILQILSDCNACVISSSGISKVAVVLHHFLAHITHAASSQKPPIALLYIERISRSRQYAVALSLSMFMYERARVGIKLWKRSSALVQRYLKRREVWRDGTAKYFLRGIDSIDVSFCYATG